MIVPSHTNARAHAHAAPGDLPAIATGFVRKLYRILDLESGAVITWTRAGTAFAIFDHERLNELILPRYFRGRLCAFRQQLREHGFQQLLPSGAAVPIAPVAPPQHQQPCTYFHEHFVRGSPGRLCKISRTPLPRRRLSSRKSKAAASAPGAGAAGAAKRGSTSASDAAGVKRARTAPTVASSPSPSPSSTSPSSSSSTVSSSTALSSSSASLSGVSSLSLEGQPPPADPLAGSKAAALAPMPLAQLLPPATASLAPSKNPLFSTESDSSLGDWLSLDDISPAGGVAGSFAAVTPPVTADIGFSEDMLGALMTLVSNSMTGVSPTSACGATSCAAQEKSSLGGATGTGAGGGALKSKVVVASGGPTVYETHQFSDDTINSMLLWLGGASST